MPEYPFSSKLKKPPAPLQWYQDAIGSNPAAKIPLFAFAGSLVGHYGLKLGSKMLVDMLMPLADSAKKAQVVDALRASKLSWLGPLAGGAIGASIAAAPHFDPASPLESLTDRDYWANNPKRRRARELSLQKRLDRVWYRSGLGPAASTLLVPRPLSKEAAISDFRDETVPVRASVDLINRDEFLRPYEKIRVGGILEGAEGGSGMVSRQDLWQSAVRTGAEFVPAYLFGQGVGKILSLPPVVTDRLSVVGGLANAIRTTGVI